MAAPAGGGMTSGDPWGTSQLDNSGGGCWGGRGGCEEATCAADGVACGG